MTTPEPVSSAPDTDALRQQALETIERELDLARSDEGYEAPAVAEEIVRRYWPDVAGLRSDLDQARAEIDRLAGMRERYRQEWIDARAEIKRLTKVYDQTHEALRGLLPKPGVVDSSLDDVPIGQLVLLISRRLACVSGDRTIPDDAAERPENAPFLRWCEWPACLRSFDARTGPGEADGKGWIYVRTGMHVLLCPDHANAGHRPQRMEWEPGDTTIRTACECGERSGELTPTNHATCMEWWRAHVLGVTPTTGPAPAAAAVFVGAHPLTETCRWCTAPNATSFDTATDRFHHAVPGVPQAPAQSTDDDCNDNLTAGFLRPSAPAVDGDTRTTPTPEEA